MIQKIFNNLSSIANISQQELDQLHQIMTDPTIDPALKVQFFSQTFLPVLQEFRQNGGDQALADKIKQGHMSAQLLGPIMAASFAQQMTLTLNVSDLQKALAPAEAAQKTMARATAMKAALATQSEADMIAGMKLVGQILPPRLKDFLNEVTDGAFDDIPKSVRERREFIRTHSVDEIVTHINTTQKAMPFAALENFLSGAAQRLTPQAASTFVETALQKMNAQDCADVTLDLIGFAEKAMEITAIGGTVQDIMKTAQAKKGVAGLAKLLTAIEDAIVTAQIIPDASDLQRGLKAVPSYPKKPDAPKGPTLH